MFCSIVYKGKDHGNEGQIVCLWQSPQPCVDCLQSQSIYMPTRCLSCKKLMDRIMKEQYRPDFCSEYCYAAHPKNTLRKTIPKWRTQKPRNSQKEIDRILKRNHIILMAFKSWSPPHQTCSDIGAMQWLKSKGYDFDVHTRLGLRSDGTTEIWCYDAGLRILPGGGAHPI